MMCSYSSSVSLPGLFSTVLAHADLADVVHVAAELDLPQQLAVEPQLARDHHRVVAHANRVAARVRILHLERFGERLHAREEQLLEPARLRGDRLLEALLVAAILEHQPALLQRLRHARAHLLEVERLREIVHRADRQAAHRHLDVGHRGDHHDRGVGLARAHLAQQLDAVHLRHAQVAQHERARVLLQQRERLLAVRRLEAGEAVARASGARAPAAGAARRRRSGSAASRRAVRADMCAVT